MTWYAWSPILYGVERDETDPTVITKQNSLALGEEVDAGKLGISDEQFEQLVAAGSVRKYPLPDGYLEGGAGNSPVEFVKAELAKNATSEEDQMLQAAAARGSAFAPPEEEILMGIADEDAVKAAAEEGKDKEEAPATAANTLTPPPPANAPAGNG